MAVSKLVVCVCGAGINTSNNARMKLEELLKKEGVNDIEVKLATIDDIETYRGRKNTVIVWMMKPVEGYDMPSVRGLNFLMGGKKAKIETTQEVIKLMNEIYTDE